MDPEIVAVEHAMEEVGRFRRGKAFTHWDGVVEDPSVESVASLVVDLPVELIATLFTSKRMTPQRLATLHYACQSTRRPVLPLIPNHVIPALCSSVPPNELPTMLNHLTPAQLVALLLYHPSDRAVPWVMELARRHFTTLSSFPSIDLKMLCSPRQDSNHSPTPLTTIFKACDDPACLLTEILEQSRRESEWSDSPLASLLLDAEEDGDLQDILMVQLKTREHTDLPDRGPCIVDLVMDVAQRIRARYPQWTLRTVLQRIAIMSTQVVTHEWSVKDTLNALRTGRHRHVRFNVFDLLLRHLTSEISQKELTAFCREILDQLRSEELLELLEYADPTVNAAMLEGVPLSALSCRVMARLLIAMGETDEATTRIEQFVGDHPITVRRYVVQVSSWIVATEHDDEDRIRKTKRIKQEESPIDLDLLLRGTAALTMTPTSISILGMHELQPWWTHDANKPSRDAPTNIVMAFHHTTSKALSAQATIAVWVWLVKQGRVHEFVPLLGIPSGAHRRGRTDHSVHGLQTLRSLLDEAAKGVNQVRSGKDPSFHVPALVDVALYLTRHACGSTGVPTTQAINWRPVDPDASRLWMGSDERALPRLALHWMTGCMEQMTRTKDERRVDVFASCGSSAFFFVLACVERIVSTSPIDAQETRSLVVWMSQCLLGVLTLAKHSPHAPRRNLDNPIFPEDVALFLLSVLQSIGTKDKHDAQQAGSSLRLTFSDVLNELLATEFASRLLRACCDPDGLITSSLSLWGVLAVLVQSCRRDGKALARIVNGIADLVEDENPLLSQRMHVEHPGMHLFVSIIADILQVQSHTTPLALQNAAVHAMGSFSCSPILLRNALQTNPMVPFVAILQDVTPKTRIVRLNTTLAISMLLEAIAKDTESLSATTGGDDGGLPDLARVLITRVLHLPENHHEDALLYALTSLHILMSKWDEVRLVAVDPQHGLLKSLETLLENTKFSVRVYGDEVYAKGVCGILCQGLKVASFASRVLHQSNSLRRLVDGLWDTARPGCLRLVLILVQAVCASVEGRAKLREWGLSERLGTLSASQRLMAYARKLVDVLHEKH